MPTVQHKSLPAGECHEAKQIIGATTADAGKVITPSSSANGQGELRRLSYAEITGTPNLQRSEYALVVGGSVNISLAAGAKVKLSINPGAAGGFTQESATGFAALWQAAQNKFSSEGAGNSYNISLRGTITSATVSNYFDVRLEEGSGGAGSGTLYQGTTIPMVKSAGVPVDFAVNSTVYSGGGLVANGLEFYVTSNAAATITALALVFERSRKA